MGHKEQCYGAMQESLMVEMVFVPITEECTYILQMDMSRSCGWKGKLNVYYWKRVSVCDLFGEK